TRLPDRSNLTLRDALPICDHAIEWQFEQRPGTGAEQLGGDEDAVLVNQSGTRESPRQTRPGLDQHLVGATRGQLLQQLAQIDMRSEEHTSELQSRETIVFR